MKLQFWGLIFVSLFVINAFASPDCRKEAKDAVEDCSTIAQLTESANSDVASGMAGQPANMNQGSANLAAVSSWGQGNLAKAQGQCQKDLDKCVNACNSAISAAKDSSLQMAIKNNMEYCHDQITTAESRLQTGQRQLASTSEGARATALSSGDSKYRDQVIDQAARSEDIQNVSMSNIDAVRKLQQIYGPGTYGSGGNEIIFQTPSGKIYVPAGSGTAFQPYTGPGF